MKTAIITGGSRGIGRASGKALAKRGFAVVVNYAGSAKDAEDAVREIEAAGGSAMAVRADVASSEAVRALFDTATQAFGEVDAVIACAGVMAPSPLGEASDAAFNRHFSINVKLGARGITVNAVAPGPVETELFLRGKSATDVERMAGMAPMKRLGQPDGIAELIAFLCSPEAGWVNGQIIRANGGIA